MKTIEEINQHNVKKILLEKKIPNFFHESGLDYVSCSPFRIPIARLSAAQLEI